MTISVIVPAAGCGARAALNGNKILAPLRGSFSPHGDFSVLYWTLKALGAASTPAGTAIAQLLVVARPEEFEAIQAVWEQCAFSMPCQTVAGGATRQDSVYAGVEAATGDFILVHDAARPCVSSAVVERTIAAALTTGAAIAALPVSDTVKRADSQNCIAATLDRSEIWLAQTPQVFRRDLFLAALRSAHEDGFQGTDCASLLERAGAPVALVVGDVNNFKVTYAADLERAAAILSSR